MKNAGNYKRIISMLFLLLTVLFGYSQKLNPSSISTNGSVNVIVQDSATIYLGGNFSVAGAKATGVAKINAAGRSAIEFPSFDGQCYTAITDGSGGWYVGGNFQYQSYSNLVHILANSSIDNAFVPNPNGTVYALYLDGTTLYVGGSFTQISHQTKRNLASLNAATAVLNSWNPNPDGTIASITKSGNNVYVGGSFNTIANRNIPNLAVISATTAQPSQFSSVNSVVNVLTQDADNIYVGGQFSGRQGLFTGSSSLFISGSDVPDFNHPMLSGQILASIPDGSGGWYLGGQITAGSFQNLVHILPNQTLDPTFAPNPNSTINCLYLDGTTLYAGGSFTQISSQTQRNLAALNTSNGTLLSWNPDPDGPVSAITKNSNTVYVGGTFLKIAGRDIHYLAAIHATTAAASQFTSVSSPVNTLAQDANNLYVGGQFSSTQGLLTGISALLTTTNDLPDFNHPVFSGQLVTSIPDGSGGWYLGGQIWAGTLQNLVHVLPNQTVDPNFAPNPNGTIHSLYLDGSTLYVGGTFSQISSQSQSNLASLNAGTGALNTWNPGVDGGVFTILKSGSTVYIGGSFTTAGGQTRTNIAALDASTALATSWAPDADQQVSCMRLNGSDIIVGGFFSNIGLQARNYLAAISVSSGAATTWDPSPNYFIETIELNGSTAYVGGAFSFIGGQPRNNIAEINLSTGSATTWNPNANNTVKIIKLIGSNVYVGGPFTTIGGQTRNGLAAISITTATAQSWNPMPGGNVYTISSSGTNILIGGLFDYLKASSRSYLLSVSKSTGLITTWNPDPNYIVETIEMNGTMSYVGGQFSQIGGQPRSHIAEINLSTGGATAWNPNADNTVKTIKLLGTDVYVGGFFSTIGGQTRNNLASLSNTTGTAGTWNPMPGGAVYSIGVNGINVLVTGSFDNMKSYMRGYALSISKTTGLITNWNPDANYIVETIELNGTNAYIGGQFSQIGGQPRDYIAEVDLSTGLATTWDPIANGTVNCIKRIGTDVYVGGSFTTIGTQTRNHLAVLNNTTGAALTWNPKPDGPVYGLLQAGSEVLVTGAFGFINSQNRSNILAITKATGMISNWNPNANGSVNTLKLNGTTMYVGGDFTTIGGQPRNRVAQINVNTGLATTWNPNADATVNTIESYGNTVYLGGNFLTLGGIGRTYLGAVNNSNGSTTAWVPNANNPVRKLAISDTVLYAAGNFTGMGSSTRNRLASFSLNTGILNSWNPDVDGTVNDIKITGSSIYICGSFSQVSGINRSNLACFAKVTGNLKGWDPGLNGTGTSIITKGKLVFVGGDFTIAGWQACNGFAAINANSGFPELFFPEVTGGTISALSVYDSLVYLVGNFSEIDGLKFGGLASIAYPRAFFKTSIDFVTPKEGGNGGSISFSVLGNGFEDGTKVRFTRTGSTTITLPDSMYNIMDGIRINGVLDLSTPVDSGLWNLVVAVPNDTTMTLNNAFRIKAYVPVEIETEVLGFQSIRVNTWQNYTVSVTNKGNVDARGIPIYIALDSTVQIDFANNFMIMDTLGNIGNSDTLVSFVRVDSLFGEPYKARVYALLLGNLPGNATDYINFKIKVTTTAPFNMRVWSSEPLYGSPLKPGLAACIDDILSTVVGLHPAAGCIYGLIRANIDPIIKATYGSSGGSYSGEFGTSGSGGVLTDYLWGNTKAIAACSGAGVIKSLDNSRKVFQTAMQLAGFAGSGNDIFNSCKPLFPGKPKPPRGVTPVASMDPNDKQGPAGSGKSHFIPSLSKMPYTIRFENVATASAPAQTVEIIDTLDLNVFDPNTFVLGGIQVGDRTISVPFGLQQYNADINLAPANNLLLRIQATFNKTTGVAHWLFTSIDPLTLEPTTDPMAGFLPPNVNSPEGEGAVVYTIKLREPVANGIVIQNKAYIYFDQNNPIVTNNWKNTVDIVKPVSHVKTLPATQLNDLNIKVGWTGTDAGSGISLYSVYYAVNGGAFKVLASNVKDTTLTLVGKRDSTYSFFCVATDSAGNVEDMKTAAEATIQLKASGLESNTWQVPDVRVFPNPNRGEFTVAVNTPSGGQYTIRVCDVTGRLISEECRTLDAGINEILVSVASSGVYFVTVGNAAGSTTRKVISNR